MLKKIILTFLMLFTLGTAIQASSVNGVVYIEAFAGGGLTYPGGNGPAGTAYKNDYSYDAGISAGYGFCDHVMIAGGAEYSYKPMTIKNTEWYNPIKSETYQFRFINISLGLRYVLNPFYFESGFFCGIPAGRQKKAVRFRDRTQTQSMAQNGSTVRNDSGGYISAGYLLRVNNALTLDIGFRVECGASYVYTDPSTSLNLMTRNAAVNLGAMHIF